MTDGADDDEAVKRICYACIGVKYLAAAVKANGAIGLCAHCGGTDPSLTIEELADEIETAFADHYMRTADGPDSLQERMQADQISSYTWTREGSPGHEAIQEAAMIDEEPAADVLECWRFCRTGTATSMRPLPVRQSAFDSGAHNAEKGPDDQAWREEWDDFEQTLKAEARFFSKTAAEHLAAVFGGVDRLKTHDGRQLVVGAGPMTTGPGPPPEDPGILRPHVNGPAH